MIQRLTRAHMEQPDPYGPVTVRLVFEMGLEQWDDCFTFENLGDALAFVREGYRGWRQR